MRARSGCAADGLPVHHHRATRTTPDPRPNRAFPTPRPDRHAAADQHLLAEHRRRRRRRRRPRRCRRRTVTCSSRRSRARPAARSTSEEVGCESAFTNPPMQTVCPPTGCAHRGGKVQWIVGNLGDIPVETIDYRTYSRRAGRSWRPRTAPASPTTAPDMACSSVSRRSRPSDQIAPLGWRSWTFGYSSNRSRAPPTATNSPSPEPRRRWATRRSSGPTTTWR